MIGAGAAGQRVVGVGLVHDRLLQGNLQAAVGAVEAYFLAGIFLHDLRNIFQHSSLSAAHASIAGGVGAVAFHKLNAHGFSGGLHRVALGNDGFIGQVTGEGIVHQHVAFPHAGQVGYLITAADFVVGEHDVRGGGNVGGVFGRNASDEQDVVTAHFLGDLSESGGSALNGLHKDGGLHVGIAGKSNQLGNGGFHFGREVVGIGVMDDFAGILFSQRGSGIHFFLTLGVGAGHDSDLIGGSIVGQGDVREAERHQNGHKQCKQFLHGVILLHFSRWDMMKHYNVYMDACQ